MATQPRRLIGLTGLLAILFMTSDIGNNVCDAFPISSSRSKNKRKVMSRPKSGFGIDQRTVPTTHNPDTSDEIKALTSFLTSQQSTGISADGAGGTRVGISQLNGMRGLYATRAFNKGEILCQIPSDCALALSDPAAKGDDAPTPVHCGKGLLQMYLQNEPAKNMWKPYLDTLTTLTKHFTPTPDFYSDEEIALLEFPRLMTMCRNRQDMIDTVAQESGLDKDALRFATWIASSRSFPIPIDDDEGKAPKMDERGQIISKRSPKFLRVLAPYLDLVNHSSDAPNVELHLIDPDKDDAWFALKALRSIPAGKEVTMCYGTGVDSSVELFMNHGFVPDANKIDAFMLKKGGDGCIESLDGWTTTLEEDELMLEEIGDDMDAATLKSILSFRVRLKRAYADAETKSNNPDL